MYFDVYYLILVLPALLFSLICQLYVKSAFKANSKMKISSGITGYEAARMMLDDNRLNHVKIQKVAGNLTDHYDPRCDTIFLSEQVYENATPAAVGVACHEAGHAVQHAEEYLPIKIRNAIIPATNITSKLVFPLFLAGILLSSYISEQFIWLAYVGVLAFCVALVFQLVTLPAEFNASRRAMAALDSRSFQPDEQKRAKRVLSAAAMTYVAALAVTLMSIIRLMLILSGRRR